MWASEVLAGGTRWGWIGAPFRRRIEADIGRDRLAQVSACEVSPAQIGGRRINAGLLAPRNFAWLRSARSSRRLPTRSLTGEQVTERV
jgi:hypothetical protein